MRVANEYEGPYMSLQQIGELDQLVDQQQAEERLEEYDTLSLYQIEILDWEEKEGK